MALRGFFSDTRVLLGVPSSRAARTALPYVWVSVYLPHVDRRAYVAFLVDTGADVTVLHPQDSLRLLIPAEIRALGEPVSLGGAGAGQRHFRCDALLVFGHDDGRQQEVPLAVHVAEPPHNELFESLLGRDALDHFIVHYDQRGRVLTLGA